MSRRSAAIVALPVGAATVALADAVAVSAFPRGGFAPPGDGGGRPELRV